MSCFSISLSLHSFSGGDGRSQSSQISMWGCTYVGQGRWSLSPLLCIQLLSMLLFHRLPPGVMCGLTVGGDEGRRTSDPEFVAMNWARGGWGIRRPRPSSPVPSPAWAGGSEWSGRRLRATSRTSPPARQTRTTVSAWWCAAAHLQEGDRKQSQWWHSRMWGEKPTAMCFKKIGSSTLQKTCVFYLKDKRLVIFYIFLMSANPKTKVIIHILYSVGSRSATVYTSTVVHNYSELTEPHCTTGSYDLTLYWHCSLSSVCCCCKCSLQHFICINSTHYVYINEYYMLYIYIYINEWTMECRDRLPHCWFLVFSWDLLWLRRRRITALHLKSLGI